MGSGARTQMPAHYSFRLLSPGRKAAPVFAALYFDPFVPWVLPDRYKCIADLRFILLELNKNLALAVR
jgi:hypothetical protein